MAVIQLAELGELSGDEVDEARPDVPGVAKKVDACCRDVVQENAEAAVAFERVARLTRGH